MKREARLLLRKACDSLVLLISIEIFNRPQDRGRVSGTLIQLDHGFEMLMKAAILQRGGRIKEKNAQMTIGFESCVRSSLYDINIRYMTEEQALVLRTLNGLRDAEQHYLLDISEGQLYIHMQSGVTLFRDILLSVFEQKLSNYLPSRVLPISIESPIDLVTLFDSEIAEIEKLLRPGKRRRVDAIAKLRPLAILDATLLGKTGGPNDTDLKRLGAHIVSGKAWTEVFKGVVAVEITTEGSGPSLSLRLSKKEGVPVRLVKEHDSDAFVVGVKRVSELDFYSLGAKQLAEKLELSMPKTLAIVDHIGLRNDSNYYKEVRIGKSLFKRYSPNAIDAIRKALMKQDADQIWVQRHASKSAPDRGDAG